MRDSRRVLSVAIAVPVLLAQTAFAGEVPKESKGCDDVSRFLISKREDNMAVFLGDYLTEMARKTPFAYLVAGLKDWKLYGQYPAGSSFYMFDFANTQLFTAYRGVGDIERAVIYGFLANSAKMQILSGELSATSDALKNTYNHLCKISLGISSRCWIGCRSTMFLSAC